MTDTQTHDVAKNKANAAFRKEQQAREGAVAMAEYVAEQKAARVRMEKLREMRLAKEAQDAEAAAIEVAAEPKPKKKKAAAKRAS